MKTVWVCRFSQALEYALPLPCHYVDGANRCIKDNQPCDAVEYVPMTALDRLDRLMSEGYYFAYQCGEWLLFRKDGECCYSGRSVSAIIKMLGEEL